MTEIEKIAIKEVLHLILDKELGTVITELMGKLPGLGGAAALALWNAVSPVVISNLDKAIDSI